MEKRTGKGGKTGNQPGPTTPKAGKAEQAAAQERKSGGGWSRFSAFPAVPVRLPVSGSVIAFSRFTCFSCFWGGWSRFPAFAAFPVRLPALFFLILVVAVAVVMAMVVLVVVVLAVVVALVVLVVVGVARLPLVPTGNC